MNPVVSDHNILKREKVGVAVLLLLLIGFGIYFFYERQKLQNTADMACPVGDCSTIALGFGESFPPEAESIPAGSGADLIKEYKNSKFRVVDVVKNPYGKQGSLYVVAERGLNDYSCGGAYGPRICYFFLETSYYGVPPIQYIGAWGNGFTAIENIKFIDENTVVFDASESDAGMTVSEKWKLNLINGSTTMTSKEITESL
jgi:hypothetical protein